MKIFGVFLCNTYLCKLELMIDLVLKHIKQIVLMCACSKGCE